METAVPTRTITQRGQLALQVEALKEKAKTKVRAKIMKNVRGKARADPLHLQVGQHPPQEGVPHLSVGLRPPGRLTNHLAENS